METLTVIAVGLTLYIAYKIWTQRVRRASLLAKYSDADVVEDIMAGKIWEGMQEEQLVESLGQPEDIATKVLKTKTVQTYKYGRVGKNRYSTRVIVENGVVVGWDKK
jgi:hypothetical protein